MIRLRLLASMFVLALALPVAALPAQSNSSIVAGLKDVKIEPARKVRGKDFKWDHGIQIALPASYGQDNRSYPVLWVTDGPMYFELAVKTVNYDLRFHVPEMIVVAVGPPVEEVKELGFRRSFEFLPKAMPGFTGFGSELLERQLAAADGKRKAAGEPNPQGGGAAQFLSFLVDELRPALARDYRMANDHVLFGDSAGGVFCVYALLARPEDFSRYVCGSPVLYSGDHELFRMEESYAKAHQDLATTVFFGAGEAEMTDPNEIVRAWSVVGSTARMVEILSLRKYPSLKLHARIFPGEDHASVVPANLSWGLRMVWEK